eukprot:TRINITY_DN3278_c0_g1_i1.p1 TRINITY_DN3278_c0_g1~~TRINITY_DN3278_c0_g1_i1.p1  ORF type:complete len:375 (+),score=58.03 TRINITY_DN3278_c0_g1_i1:63-1187(+)
MDPKGSSSAPLKVPVDDEDSRFTKCFRINQETEIKNFFSHYGFVVVRDVITPDECAWTLNEIWEIFEEQNPEFDRNDPDNWLYWPDNSIVKFGNPSRPPIFTPQFLNNRQNPNIYKVFSLLLQEENLLVNHDRCCLFRPTKNIAFSNGNYDYPKWKTAANLHIDMNPWNWLKNGEECQAVLDSLRYIKTNQFIQENNQASHKDGIQIQAVLNLIDNEEQDGGFQCVPGFHREFAKYFSQMEPPNPNSAPSYQFPPNDIIQKSYYRVTLRAGSIVLWDQRLPHGSRPNNSSRFRSAQFLKMFPARLVNNNRQRSIARAKAILGQIENSKTPVVITPLGEKVFGLEVLKKDDKSQEKRVVNRNGNRGGRVQGGWRS